MEQDAHVRSGGSSGPAASGDALLGRVLDRRYRVDSRIARGGMASVYEAHDLRLDRTVAVKVMHAGLGDGAADRDFAERFVREARAAARLSHPNVVAVYDQGDDDGVVYLVMELITGHTLRDTIGKESPMTPARALAVLEPVVSALATAHRAGLIHRDVKPENVLIADDGRIKVADFGLAKAVSADTQHTATQGVLIGTVSYLAPELVTDGRADARADVYAVGVVLYELLTGVKPHAGESPIQVAYRHVHHDVPPPSERVRELPPYVDALVARATARDPSRRPADAAVLLHQLHRVSHALADGVRDDPELTQDLAPILASLATDIDAEAEAEAEVGTGTAPIVGEEPSRVWSDASSGHATRTIGPMTRAIPERAGEPVSPSSPEPAPTAGRGREPRRPRRRRRGLLILLLALLLAVGVGGGAYWYGYARYITAPKVTGLEQAAAESALGDADLVVAFADPVYDQSVPQGTVVESDPKGGSRVLPGDTVTLTLSLGKLLVPKTKGLSEDDAQQRLVERQLEFGESSQRFSEGVPEGQVIASTPKAGTELKPGDVVDLVVSKGRRPIPVGEWIGKQVDRMRTVLERRKLVLVVDGEDFHDTLPAGAVISQQPSQGTLFRGQEVHVRVSKGPELVEVPSVFGMSAGDAEATLRSAGFDVRVEQADFYFGFNRVSSTNPSSGNAVPKGSTITIYVA
ncbi:Stk1 family PASTA domain-containing Ser/Thr kinase [Nocardioides sp. R-C-SC26]|uniref:Stk1 family PASTA domain-containing Ser/Thr kinase n=1 Tax=Nocardioides sp. R-C-SC26 TaxID=2870414 RepID=UPI001E33C4AA|nr:Stk1 family PASTA domain-containing Ser/Thr kinase [Nocardioides sp. R-C-SC26]